MEDACVHRELILLHSAMNCVSMIPNTAHPIPILVCQLPFVNVFKQFGVGQWKKCCKEGDVTPVMVRTVLRATPSPPS